MPIDFTLSPEQRALQDDAHVFAERVLAPISAQIDAIADPTEAFCFTRAAYREMAKAGFTKSFIPVVNGGLGFELVDFALAVEELARVDVNVPTTLLASGVGLQPVIQFGNAAQRKLFLQPFVDDADGELLAAFGFTEVGGGANFDSADAEVGVQTFARRDGDEWVVTGQKHYTTSVKLSRVVTFPARLQNRA